MDASQKGRPPDALNGEGAVAGAQLQKTQDYGAYPTVAGLLCKQISHMVCAAEKFALANRRRAWAYAQIYVAIWRRRIEIQKERRSP